MGDRVREGGLHGGEGEVMTVPKGEKVLRVRGSRGMEREWEGWMRGGGGGGGGIWMDGYSGNV